MRIVSLLAAIALFFVALTGCSTEGDKELAVQKNKIVGTFTNVKVIDKKEDENGRMSNDYLIMIEKGGQKVQLQTKGEESFNAIQKGNIITVGYNKDFEIQKITFEKMEESK